ncbi:FadR/GntR family transcriptional regulator [Paracoccus benzoatiresistens]|uniref:FadR/GntR family transcriptional regulator n=1 Tax=Paracoccus benzoatiresistens TaxID=2997341 RepID=UPI003530375A
MHQSDVVSALQDLVGGLSPGDRLPAERALARSLGCSRQTLRAGLAALQREGLIWRHVGQGTFVGPAPRGLALRGAMLPADASPADLIRARLLLEPPIAAEATRRADASDIAELQRLVQAGRRAQRIADCERSDSDFHHAIARMTRNPAVVGVMAWLTDARRHAPWQRGWNRSYRRLAAATFQTSHSDQHRQIVDAIAAGHDTVAFDAMTGRLEKIGTGLDTVFAAHDFKLPGYSAWASSG